MIDLLRAPFRKRSLAELLYALLGFPLAIPGFLYAVGMPLLSLGLALTLLGVPLFVVGMRGARGLAGMYRSVARGLLGLDVHTPPKRRRGLGVLQTVKEALTDSMGWRALLYMLIKLPLATLTLAAAATFWGYGIGLLTYPLWWHFLPSQGANGTAKHGIGVAGSLFLDTVPSALSTAIVGLIVLLVAPWVVHGLVTLDRLLIQGLLGATTLTERVRELETSRNQAVDDAAASLRRIERDLHDGTQARLVSLAMKIGLAKEELSGVRGPVDLRPGPDRDRRRPPEREGGPHRSARPGPGHPSAGTRPWPRRGARDAGRAVTRTRRARC